MLISPKNKARYAALLKENKLKATPTRLLVLEVLRKATGPRSADEIHSLAQSVRPIDRVTVYRILDAFYNAGLLERTRAGGQAWLYHLAAVLGHDNHPHFHCSGCGALQCLPPDTVNVDLERLKSIFPAQLDHLSISLDGVCPSCLAKKDS